jgi:hypothetical protein
MRGIIFSTSLVEDPGSTKSKLKINIGKNKFQNRVFETLFSMQIRNKVQNHMLNNMHAQL